jgi:glutathione synthase/RimK-type ligase-like ATP-grasp enzyme
MDSIMHTYLNNPVYRNGYVSRLIDKEAEYRVAVIQGRVAWVAKKTPGNPEDIAWNVARGGRFDNVKWGNWPMLVVREALKAAKVSGADFCGVDVMTDIAGTPYVLEVNSAPSQTSEYRQRCFAKCFDYIVQHGKEAFPDVKFTAKTSWKSTIHPALKTE